MFVNGIGGNSDAVYHQGSVMIGSTNLPSFDLHVHNGLTTGTDVNFGSVEETFDTADGILLASTLNPMTDNSISLGTSTRRWTEVSASNGVINTSDARDKEIISPLTYGIKEVLLLNPVSFQWKKEKIKSYIIPDTLKRTHLGFIAQEVLTVIPEAVKTHYWKEYEENPDVLEYQEMHRLGINYSKIIPVVIKSIQEQEEILQQLEARNALLIEMLKTIATDQKN